MVLGRSHSIKDYPGQLTGLMMISALVGALTAIFTTPRTGYEARTRLKERGRRMKERWQEYLLDDADAGDMGDLASQAKTRAAEAGRKVSQGAAQKSEEIKGTARSKESRSNNKEEGKP